MIEILMATYNGERYLREQLDSILNQTHVDWVLTIQDDCSTDGTVDILKEYQQKYPDKVRYSINTEPSGCAKNNFFSLINKCKSQYAMFADQDDVWDSNKIEISVAKMREMEVAHGKDVPLLVHTDLRVVNENLQLLNKSMFKMQHMDPDRCSLNYLVVQNIITGCTVLVNRPLLDKVKVIPQQAKMHDMWLGLIAAAFGNIGFVSQATIRYRQHDDNSNGARSSYSTEFISYNMKNGTASLIQSYRQALEFVAMYGKELPDEERNMLMAYAQFDKISKIKRIHYMKRYRLQKKGLIKIIGQILK